MGFGFRRFSSNKWTPVITGVAIGIYSGMVALWLPLAGDHGPAVRAVAVCTGSARRGATAPLWEAVAVVSSDARGWGRDFLNGRHPVLHQRHVSPGGSHYGHVLGTNLLVSS